MERIVLRENINILCLSAQKVPDSIADTRHQLREMIPHKEGRRFFGLSRPKADGSIGYAAAAEQLDTSEADILGLQEYTIPEGSYYCRRVPIEGDSRDAITAAFMHILEQPDVDPNGFWLEWYPSEVEVHCMVHIRETKSSGT